MQNFFKKWSLPSLKQLDFDKSYTRNLIYDENKNTHQEIIVQEIECSVKYQDLIEDTVKGLLTAVRYDLGRNEELLLFGKSGMNGWLGAHNVLHQLRYAGIYKICLYVWPKYG